MSISEPASVVVGARKRRNAPADHSGILPSTCMSLLGSAPETWPRRQPLHPFFNTHACSRQLRWPTAKSSNQGAISAHDEIARQWLERPPATVIGSDNQSDICALLTVPKRLNLELVGFAIFADTFVSIFLFDQSSKFRVRKCLKSAQFSID